MSVGLLKAIVGIIAAYLLLSAMIRNTGLRSDNGRDIFLPYMGLSLLYVGAVLIGFILLIIPGLFLVARWILAQPLVIARGDGVMQAFGESWEKTRGNEFQILVVMLALLCLFILIVIACTVMLAKDNLVGIVISQLASSAMSVTSLTMGVAPYGLMIGTAKAAN